jgi:hypothetical protein
LNFENYHYFIASHPNHSSRKILIAFELPEEQVVVLGHAQNLKAGDVVMAVYPETTAFYMGTVSSVPRKHGGGGTNFVMISFMDDHDENGITHDKAVSIQYIFKPQ